MISRDYQVSSGEGDFCSPLYKLVIAWTQGMSWPRLETWAGPGLFRISE